MKTILITIVSFFLCKQGFAQRCGYDYLQAFVVKIVDIQHPNNIPNLKLTLANEFGEKLLYPSTSVSDIIEDNKTPVDQRLKLPFMKKIATSEFMEFWENKNVHGLSFPGLNIPAHLNLEDDLYVIFVNFPYSINQQVGLPVFQLIVEDPDSIQHFKQFPKRIYRLDPEKAVYLCANHLVGEGLIKNKAIHCVDGSNFEPIQFNLTTPQVPFTGKVQKSRYVKMGLKDAYPNTSHYPDRLVTIEDISIYDGANLQLMQKINCNSFAKFTKKSNQLSDFKWFYEKHFPANMKSEFVNEFKLNQGLHKVEMLSVLLQIGNSFSGVPFHHKLYFYFDSFENQYILDTLLSNYPNVQIQNAYHEKSRYEILDNVDECKLIYYILEGHKWVLQKESVIRTKKQTSVSKRTVLDDVGLVGYNWNGIKRINLRGVFTQFDTFYLQNKSNKQIDLSLIKLIQNQNPYMCKINLLNLPAAIGPQAIIPVVVELSAIKNLKINDGSLPFERIYSQLDLKLNNEMLSLKINYLVINSHRILNSTQYKLGEGMAEEILFETFIGSGYQLMTQNNEIEAYGKWINAGDTVQKVGYWNYSNPRKMIEFDREFNFIPKSSKGLVDSQLVIKYIFRGKLKKLNYIQTGESFRVWIPKMIDTVEFNWNGEWNQISRFNHETHQNSFWVNLLDTSHQFLYPTKYNEFVTQQSIAFVPNTFLIKLIYEDIKNANKERDEFMKAHIGLDFSISDRYPENILIVHFDELNPNEMLKYLIRWEHSNQVVSVHQKVLINKTTEIFLGKNITVRPKLNYWSNDLNEVVNKLGFTMLQNFGNSDFYLGYSGKVADKSLFFEMMKLIRNPNFVTANVEYLNPIKPVLDSPSLKD